MTQHKVGNAGLRRIERLSSEPDHAGLNVTPPPPDPDQAGLNAKGLNITTCNDDENVHV